MKELRCTNCKKRVITERENTLHTEYISGLCEECKAPTVVEGEHTKEEVKPVLYPCKVCGKDFKTKGGLKLHKRTHK